jgi:microcystin degradation protein MlrC
MTDREGHAAIHQRDKPMKIFCAGIAHETNTFSPLPAGRAAYERSCLFRGDIPEDNPNHITAPVVEWRKGARERGWQLVEGLITYTEPCGQTPRAVYEAFREELLDELGAAMPVEIVLLRLHGAMVADGYDDCEGDLITRVRALVGPGVTLGAELDPHCHLTDEMTGNADLLVIYKQFPHTDIVERAADLFRLCAETALGNIRPTMAAYDCRMIGSYFTTLEPMKGFVDRIEAMEGSDGVLNISPVHGFPYADVPALGTRMLVTTDDDPDKAAALASALGRELIGLRGRTRTPQMPLAEAVAYAATHTRPPLVLADNADNPGGGAPGDATFMLRAFLDAGVGDTVFVPVWDPIAVQVCFDAGEGTQLDLRIGGKMGSSSGDPVDLAVTVRKLRRDVRQRFGRAWTNLGDCAAVAGAGITIVLASKRFQATGLEALTDMGIEPAACRNIVVKSTNHFRTEYEKIAGEIRYVDAPGALAGDLVTVPYTRIRRPIWPLDEDPWTATDA